MSPGLPAALLALVLAPPVGVAARARVPAPWADTVAADGPVAGAPSAAALPGDTLAADTAGARVASAEAADGRRDAWLGEDKLKHLSASFALTEFGYAGLRMVGAGHGGAEAGALAVAALTGVAKEAWDAGAGRGFSLRDLTWDLVGVALGALVVRRTR